MINLIFSILGFLLSLVMMLVLIFLSLLIFGYILKEVIEITTELINIIKK